ncbi:MAG: glucosidase [Candidatus Eremiobacteraeota bacterium]|nr:glucosidase [Candidatus Eremiobacteraeota bacterium]
MDWNPERARVEAEARRTEHWTHWGPYLSDRQWGTVREDYSATGEAWEYLPFDHARSRAYRWGEDGIFGISDDHQRLCFAPAFWNGNDPIVKERFFGLSGHQGNHGEDVKELYYFLDNVPSHAYMRALYKYPHAAYPYADLVATNSRRSRNDPEYELIDTGIFDDDAYFDIEIEYAKRAPADICIRITATNRGGAAAPLHVIPQLWFRNEWSWSPGQARGRIVPAEGVAHAYVASHPETNDYWLYTAEDHDALYCENETNTAELFGARNAQPYVKDGIDRAIRGESDAVNPQAVGSKLGLHVAFTLAPGETRAILLRLSDRPALGDAIDATFAGTFKDRLWEADRFYSALTPFPATDEDRRIQRTAFAGMLWSKQYYFYVVRDWLRGDPLQPPPPPERAGGRNHDWIHLYNDDVISMPDTWEYPWYAAWDLAFHAVVLSLVDPGFAKRQLITLTREWYMHPDGQIPAYEWQLGDVNPPVHAWAAYRIFQIEHKMYGVADYLFLERVFQKLLLNFTWWVNREDPLGQNVFMGGFLGLDNVGIFDRSAPLPTGGHILQSDATSWMAVYALDMMAIALELAQHNPSYEDIASKFFEHFLYIAHAMNEVGDADTGLWDEADGFYYDKLVLPNGEAHAMRVRSMVGLLPLMAVETLQPALLEKLPNFTRRLRWFVENRPELRADVASLDKTGVDGRRLLSVLDGERLARLLKVMLDENAFLSPYGIRSLSKEHQAHPLVVKLGENEFRVDYDPAESRSGLFGGNSNWRGPVWFPINFLLIEALQNFHFFFGDAYRVEFPTGSGNLATLWEIASDLSRRLVSLFTPDANGRRPFNGGVEKFQRDPHFRNLLLFHEYFHGDNGAGIGASHQTGWTGLVAKLLQQISEYESAGKSPLEWHYEAMPDSAMSGENE